jgi:hypothetical protein
LQRVFAVEKSLMGKNPSALLALCARKVSTAWLESYTADHIFYGKVFTPGGLVNSKEIRRWRAAAHRRLTSSIRTMAFVAHCEASSVRAAYAKLTVA